jgi:3',5'-cyclic AMP phosphodiesterase CpdA
MKPDDSTRAERWALLSDPHIDADVSAVSRWGESLAGNLRKVVGEILAERDSLDGVIINGDCAHIKGKPGDYRTLAELLEPLREAGLPVLLTLGNHDGRAAFLDVFPRKDPGPVADRLVTVVEGRWVIWLILDSLREAGRVEGELGASQLDWLKGYLAENRSKPVILAAHHYPQPSRDDIFPGTAKVDIPGLLDGEEFLRMANAHPQVKAYVFGHSHDWRVSAGGAEIHQINLPSSSYPFNPSRPVGWVRAEVGPSGMVLELRALDREHPEHGRRQELKWR